MGGISIPRTRSLRNTAMRRTHEFKSAPRGLKERTGAFLERMKPKRKRPGTMAEINRPTTAPHLYQEGRRASMAIANALRLSSTISTATDEDMTPPLFAAGGEHPEIADSPVVKISGSLLMSIVEVAKGEQDLEAARQLESGQRQELDEILRMLYESARKSNHIADFLVRNGEAMAMNTEDPEANKKTYDEEIDMYEGRSRLYRGQTEHIHDRRDEMIAVIETLEQQQEKRKAEVFQAIRTAFPELCDQVPSTFEVGNFEPAVVFDKAQVDDVDKDFEEFTKSMKPENIQQDDEYPMFATGDHAEIAERSDHLAACRRDYERLLAETEQACATEDAEVASVHRNDIKLAKKELADAVDACRRIGLHCRANGSFIVNVPGGPFWDLRRHGHEVIVGRMDEEGIVSYFYESEEDSDEMTEEEFAAQTAQYQKSTEDWLDDGSLAGDPNEIEPREPSSPNHLGFQDNLSEIEVGESGVEPSSAHRNPVSGKNYSDW